MTGQDDIKVTYRELTLGELDDSLFASFDRHQVTTHVWAAVGDHMEVVADYFVEDWNTERKHRLVLELSDCMASGGVVLGAFERGRLVGIANLQPTRFGTRNQYVELQYLHVTADRRNHGIGRRLFELCCEAARRLGATKLYLATHNSVDSQAFYDSLGCRLAEEINASILAHEPRDIQREYYLGG